MIKLIDENQKVRIRETIKKVELTTSGELVTVIATESDDYYFIPTLWASLIALLVPGLVLLGNIWIEYHYLYSFQVFLFFTLAAVFRIPTIKMRLIPKHIKYQRANRIAREQFFAQNLHHTHQRTGILIFVSAAEQYVEIIADKGINDVVSPDTWEKIIQDFIVQVKQDQYAQGFVTCIEQCGAILQQHFPAEKHNPNELEDHLIEI